MADTSLPHPSDLPVLADVGGIRWSRRTAIGVGGAAMVALAVPTGVSAAVTVPTYSLDPTLGGSCISPGCSVCNACRSHAANKLFASETAAEAGRAHPGCRCSVVPGMTVAQPVFDELFANGVAADRRTPAIGALLASPPATVSAPGIAGLVPGAVTVGGVLAIAWLTVRRRLTDGAR